MQLKPGIIMNVQPGKKGISTYDEANETGLKNNNSWSTHVLQPEVPIRKSLDGFFIPPTLSPPGR